MKKREYNLYILRLFFSHFTTPNHFDYSNKERHLI